MMSRGSSGGWESPQRQHVTATIDATVQVHDSIIRFLASRNFPMRELEVRQVEDRPENSTTSVTPEGGSDRLKVGLDPGP